MFSGREWSLIGRIQRRGVFSGTFQKRVRKPHFQGTLKIVKF